MSYLKTWHKDYAAESIKRINNNESWFYFAVECGQVSALLANDGDFASKVATTVIEIIEASSKLGAKSRRKITNKQREIVAEALSKKYKTAAALAAAVWGLAEEDINNASV